MIEAISRHVVVRIFVHTYTHTQADRINMYDKNVNIILVARGEKMFIITTIILLLTAMISNY